MNRAQWMADGTYGMMVHWFVYPTGNTPEEKTNNFNERVNAFDVAGFMKQFDQSGADWLIFTMGQNGGYWNSSNEYLDKVLPGHTPKRDLAMEIAQEVKKRNKKFIIYLAGTAAGYPEDVKTAFNWKGDEATDNSENTAFIRSNLAFMKAYAQKFGENCDGFWIDGLYEAIHQNKWNWEDWCQSMRSGNPDCAVALSDASFAIGKLTPLYDKMDYFAGETHYIENGMIRIDPIIGAASDFAPNGKYYLDENGKPRTKGQAPKFHLPESQYIGGVQWQALIPVDLPFNGPAPTQWVRYPKEEVIKLVVNCKKVKGAVTINLPVDGVGLIPQSSLNKIIAVKEAIRK